MDYINTNKEAWEEVFPKHQEGYKQDIAGKIAETSFSYLNTDTINELKNINLSGMDAAQFCCNNGRELLSMMKLGLKSGTGFDIAEPFVNEANRLARSLDYNCTFHAVNIYDIGDEFSSRFDLLFISIGAMCWFDDLPRFFRKVAGVLKPGGFLLINEQHPVCGMIAACDEKEFDPDHPKNMALPYFRQEPWFNDTGMDYIGGTTYKSKTFTSFSHTLSSIINSITGNNMQIMKFNEYDYDISDMFAHISGQSIPLSYILVGRKLS